MAEKLHRLKVKVGIHEFEAEGSHETVAAMFEAWKALVEAEAKASLPQPSQSGIKPKLPATVMEVKTKDGMFAAPWDIFDCDEKQKVCTIRVHPVGENRDADAALLVLYGGKRSFEQQDMPVTKLKEALEVSGLRPERIDRTLAAYIKAGYVMKAGRAKGGRYRLTNTGYARADELARALFEKLELP